MPNYDYFCQLCKERSENPDDEKAGIFEVQQSIKDEPLQECPHCKELKIINVPKKLISLSSFHLKGGSWSKDNYK